MSYLYKFPCVAFALPLASGLTGGIFEVPQGDIARVTGFHCQMTLFSSRETGKARGK